MRRPSIAHGLFTWQDGRVALEASLRSTAGFVDHVLIADGLIDGVPDEGLPWVSNLDWMPAAEYLPARVPISTHGPWQGAAPWETLSSACTWILQTAKMLGADWLLFIDADQELHGGEYLHAYLQAWRGDAFPIQRIDGPGPPNVCPWQLIRVSAFRRYVSGCYVLERENGEHVNLVPPGHEGLPLYERRPWISHHPERRPPWRINNRLGKLETVLEPPPLDVPTLIQPDKLL